MMNKVERIGVTEVLGKEIVFYNSWEEPLFLVVDIANWIEHTHTTNMVKIVDDCEKLNVILLHAGQNREVLTLTEDGLYEVLMQSRKPIAKELKKAIKDYLKQIRKTGGTVETGREEYFINNYFPSFSEEVKLSMVQDLLKTNKELKPKAEYYDKTLRPAFLKTATEVGKDLGMTANALNTKLHEFGVIQPKMSKGKIKGWFTYAKYDYLVPEYIDYHVTEYNQTLKFTEKGREWVINFLEENK